MMCSNCMEENDSVFEVLPEKKYNACAKCSVTYGKDRTGYAFIPDQEVYINDYHQKSNGRVFVIKGIFINEECESGRLVYLIDKETGKPLKSVLDCNWLIKLDNNKN